MQHSEKTTGYLPPRRTQITTAPDSTNVSQTRPRQIHFASH
jgi:hypothetical protein